MMTTTRTKRPRATRSETPSNELIVKSHCSPIIFHDLTAEISYQLLKRFPEKSWLLRQSETEQGTITLDYKMAKIENPIISSRRMCLVQGKWQFKTAAVNHSLTPVTILNIHQEFPPLLNFINKEILNSYQYKVADGLAPTDSILEVVQSLREVPANTLRVTVESPTQNIRNLESSSTDKKEEKPKEKKHKSSSRYTLFDFAKIPTPTNTPAGTPASVSESPQKTKTPTPS